MRSADLGAAGAAGSSLILRTLEGVVREDIALRIGAEVLEAMLNAANAAC